MKHSYKKLLEVAVDHEYGSLSKPYFNIVPTADCAELLKNTALLFRPDKDSFKLLYSCIKDSDEVLKPIDEQLKFRFYLKLEYADFHNISDLPFEGNKIYYFSNATSAADGDKLLLNSESPVKTHVTEEDLYDFSSQTLRIDEESPVPVTYAIHTQEGLEIYSKTITPVEGRIFHEYNFSHRPAGLYELRKNGIKEKSFYADNSLLQNRTFAVLEIHTGEGIPADYVITKNDGTVTARSYSLKFKSRSTTWRYFVIPQYSTLEDDDTLVIEGNSEITFSAGVEEILPSGESAFVFKSASAFPVKKTAQKSIALKKEDGVSKTLINHLPNPVASSLSFEEEKVYSDIFVYI